MNKRTHIGLLIAALLLAQPAHAGGQLEEAMSANVRSSLQRALAELPDATRSVLWLYHAEGYTH